MIYILDTNILRKLLEHLPRKGVLFENLWQKIELEIENEQFISVDECFNELTNHYDEKNSNYLWLKEHKKIFKNPTNEESLYIKQIFSYKKMQDSVRKKQILQNRPVADAFLVAKAKVIGATVVSAEVYKPNSAQIPNMCELLDVKYISYDDFMELVSI